MKSVSNPIAAAALSRAIRAAKSGPASRPRYDSRSADKFVIRGFEELLTELDGIGRHQGRSRNSEVIAAILEALSAQKRAYGMLTILKSHLGEDLVSRVLAEVPDFDLAACKTADSFVVRLPSNVRDTIRDGVAKAVADGSATTMNKWLVNVLAHWVRLQRQQYALLSAAYAVDTALLGCEHPGK